MRRIVSVLAALLISVAWLAMVPTTARADGEDWRILRYDVVAKAHKQGVTAVQLTLDFDFGNEAGHGPYIVLPLKQIGTSRTGEAVWRLYDYTVGAVSSPSGANATVESGESDGNLVIRVGSEGRTFTGVQTYQISYTVRGLVEPNQQKTGLDEFNWQVVGGGWQVPIDKVTVHYTGPAQIIKAACFYTVQSPCETATEGKTATYSASGVGNGAGVEVVAGYPVGTFVGAEPHYTHRMTVQNMFPITALTGPAAVVVAAGGLFLLYRRTRRSGRDEVYLGMTPGVTPASGEQTAVGHDSTAAPVAVAFQPPKGARPGEIGTLMDATADDRDITATLVDLAVRGHMAIEQTGKKDFTFTLKQSPDQLVGYESNLVSNLFRSSGQVTTDDLRDTSYSSLLSDTRTDLYDRVTKELRWYSRSPRAVRVGAILAGVALVGAGVGLGFLLGLVGWGLIGIAVAIVGIGVLIRNNRFGRRTANGSAVLAQAKGFELYLTTAEADQIKFEEGVDIFSRYLPYAMVFGVADRWTTVFEKLAADGRYTFSPYWYVGYGYGLGHGFGMGDLSHSLNSLSSSVSSSIQAASAATSGGSGFSGGGGFGGG
ncbi:MAG TPA: DUF2207 domain-containing protein, partial [Propionibacteriaceae bacterium]|nr:DUF2207 domain-containing protein [Propionibacteriaceae bacterium]